MSDQTEWRRLSALFDQVVDADEAQAKALLAKLARDDPTLHGRLLELLRADAAAAPFLETPAAESSAELIAQEDSWNPEGRRIGAHRVIRELGRGGMGVVLLAERVDGAYHQEVAIKVLPWAASATLQQRLLAERQLLSMLQHPNIARLLDGGINDDGVPYLVMEYVDGVPLHQYLQAQNPTLPEVLDLFLQICAAVQHAHGQLIVHRDIKPQNILVRKGQAVLLDFGIARLLEVSDLPTRTLTQMLTPAYSAPEQIRGGRVTTAIDIYALGLVLYEALCGHRAQQTSDLTPAQIERAVCDTTPLLPSLRCEGRRAMKLRGDLDRIVMHALEKDPAQRYQSVAELADDVRRFQAGEPVRALPPSTLYRARKFLRRHWLGALSTAAVITLLTASTIISIRSEARVSRALATSEAERVRAEATLTFMRDVFSEANPYSSPLSELSAGSMLDQAVANIQTGYETQPSLKADLLLAIGTVLDGLGESERAVSLLDEAVMLRRQQLPESHAAQAEILHRLSIASDRAGDLEAAIEYAREALALRLNQFGRGHPVSAESLDQLGSVIAYSGDLESGLELSREAVQVFRETTGMNSQAAETALHNLGWVLLRLERYPEAESVMTESITLSLAARGPQDADLLGTKMNYAVLLRRTGRLDESLQVQKEVLSERSTTLGPDHPDLAYNYNNIATVQRLLGQYDQAAQNYRRAVTMFAAVRGDDHPVLAGILANIGKTEAELGNTREALQSYQRALAIAQQNLPGDSRRYATILIDAAELDIQAGLPDAARDKLHQARDQWQQIDPQSEELERIEGLLGSFSGDPSES